MIKDKKLLVLNLNLLDRLQTLDGQSFRYIVAINFTILGGFKTQKHTLSIWKNVRKLQDKFNKIEYQNITLNNQIVIESKEVIKIKSIDELLFA